MEFNKRVPFLFDVIPRGTPNPRAISMARAIRASVAGPKTQHWLGVLVPTCNPSTWETEAGGGSQVSGQPGRHNKTVSKKKQNPKMSNTFIVMCKDGWVAPGE
jgi:hypothetical protein